MGGQEAKVDEVTADPAEPELLYHYTDQKGLLGILGGREKCIWATHLQYLNDTTEGQIFSELLLDELNRRAATEPEKASSNITAMGRLLGLSIDQADHQNETLY
ncbi:MAG TPA: hypothetical protein VMD29_04205, partial [Terracidiphilus sp.]|nr:hypothetical protein [Terracidiphilus sp.]